MKQLFIIAATALWVTAITSTVFAFVAANDHGLFEAANIVALMACVPTFWLMAESRLEHYHQIAQRQRVELVGELAEMLGRSDAQRDIPRVTHR